MDTDLSRPVATSPDNEYSLSIEEAAQRYEHAGLPRTLRTIQRYCAKGHLDSRRVEIPYGEKYLITPASVAKHIAYIEEVRQTVAGRDEPRLVAPSRSMQTQDSPEQRQSTTSRDEPRPTAAESDAVSRYVVRLEGENTFLRDQIGVKDTRAWNGVTSSSDGTVLAAAPYADVNNFSDDNDMYVSDDGGTTWTQQTGPGTGNWQGVALSADGTKLAAAELGGDIWTGVIPTPSAPPPAPTPSGGGGGMIIGSGPSAPSAAGLPGYVKPRPQIDYPDGQIVYLDATSSATTPIGALAAAVPASPTLPVGASSTPLVFSANHQLWDEGPDILALQQFLNTHGFIVSESGPGSPGDESDFFGMKTYDALIKFQDAHAATILAPFGFTAGTGYFGSSTRAYVNGR